MREILFKGKDKNDGNWYEGYYVQLHDDRLNKAAEHHYIVFERMTDRGLLSDPLRADVFPETVCQYTGITDKGGRKIFEGDILSAHLDDQCPDATTYVQVIWNGFSWCIRENTKDVAITKWDCNFFEVCGNIFENSTLLGN